MADTDVRAEQEVTEPAAEVVAPSRMSIRELLHEYRPSVVTGGASAAPLLTIAALNGADELDRSAFGVLLPEIRDYFGVSISTALTVFSVAALLPILLSLPLGYASDRWNRTKMIGIGAIMWGAFSMGTAFSATLLLLAATRMGSGLGKTLAPSYNALLSDHYPQERRLGVFAVSELGNRFGTIVAPTLAGLLASWFFWQAPFLLFGIPSIVLGIFALLKLREPVRGEQERRAMGADEAAALEGEPPPSWSEAWRIGMSVRTLRRVWSALPLLVGSVAGILTLKTIYWEETYGLTARDRGLLGSVDEIVGLVGLVVGAAYGNKLLSTRPRAATAFLASLAIITAIGFAAIALSPWLWLAVGLGWIPALMAPVFGPAAGAVMSLAIPPRARGFALAMGALWVAPGLAIIPLAGRIADTWGARAGILALVPVFLLGAAMIGSAGISVEADIRAATAAASASNESRRAKQAGRAKLLVCRDLDVSYGPVQILFGVDFDVSEGEIVALLGTNGAGKSTLLNAIAGLNAAANGAIFFDGEDITYLPPSAHVERGIVTVPGGKGVFPTLTVAENLRLAAYSMRKDAEHVRTATEEVLSMFPRLRERLDQPAGTLSGGEQQMFALGQAFLTRPRLLLIDELSLGLAPAVVEQLLEVVRRIHAQGTTIVLVEQSVNVAMTVADRVVFMEKGEVRFSGPAAELLGRNDVLRSVFLAGAGVGSSAAGRKRRALRQAGMLEPTDVVLDVRGVRKSFGGVSALNDASLTLREGEILGLIGPNGAGKTTLFDAISGFLEPDAGSIRLAGEELVGRAPEQIAALGLARSFQDARLVPSLTVEETLLVALDKHLSSRNVVTGALRLPGVTRSEARLRKRAERLIGILNLGPFRDKFIRELSTGTRRLVDLACVLAADPTVLLLDEPSSGIAQRETEELGPLIQRIKSEAACSILIIEHDMPLISSVSDELIAMELGAVITRGDPDAVLADPRVIESYLGTSEEVIKRSGSLT